MSSDLCIALDLSCAAERPVTGIGYAAIYQMRALFARDDGFRFKIVATGDRQGAEVLRRELKIQRAIVLPYARLAKYHLWTKLSWPPFEWVCGPAHIVHNLGHQTPAARRARRLVTIHDLSVFRCPDTHTPRNVKVQTTLIRQCGREADAIVAVSQSCKDDLVDILGVAEDRVRVVPNGVQIEEFDVPFDEHRLADLKSRLGIQHEYFIHLGTLEPRKNLGRLLDAYDRMRARRGDSPQLVLVGAVGWKSHDIVRRAAELAPFVIHAGYLPRHDAVLLLRGARACIYPSLYEGFGLPVLEAMAARTPVVTSSVSSLPEVAGDSALYVDPESIDSIADGMDRVLYDTSAAQARAMSGRARAESMSWDRSAAALAKLYREVV